MQLDRRSFLRLAALSGALGAAGVTPASATLAALTRQSGPTVRPLRILILGGTGFIGPYQVRYAVERGHQVTVFNRGRRQADLPDGVEHLQGDRNGDLAALQGRRWDVAIDNPTTLPVWVRDAGAVLRDSVDHYVFVSTISVYSGFGQAGMTEDSPLAPYGGADPMAETLETFRESPGALYGPLKALAEAEAERWFPGRTTVVRPGLIVGPGDPTDRFTYWPVRVARGGTVLAPNTPADPVQVIDARDLSEWIVRLVEQRSFGVFNGTGPSPEMGFGSMLEAMRPLATGAVDFEFVPHDFLEAQGVRPWSDLPAWVPPAGEMGGMLRVSIARALAAGLTFRPISRTAADTLEWHRTLPAERQARLMAGLPAEREQAVLHAWTARSG
jgi:2'-hydroxyisoflavone reductase